MRLEGSSRTARFPCDPPAPPVVMDAFAPQSHGIYSEIVVSFDVEMQFAILPDPAKWSYVGDGDTYPIVDVQMNPTFATLIIGGPNNVKPEFLSYANSPSDVFSAVGVGLQAFTGVPGS